MKSPSFVVNFGMIDLELEQALALSRGDTELQEALALSRRESEGVSAGVDYGNTTLAMNDDQALQLALERSKTEGALALSKIVSDHSSMSDKVAMDDDQALRLALERSRTESLAHRKAISPTQSKCDKSENILVDTAALDLKDREHQHCRLLLRMLLINIVAAKIGCELRIPVKSRNHAVGCI